MGFKTIELKLPTDYSEEMLRESISHELHITGFSYRIENKSLDARTRSNIFWLVKVAVSSHEIKGGVAPSVEKLEIQYKKRKEKVVVVGSGPAGFFCAFVLQKAGFQTTLIERGSNVKKREQSIYEFEAGGSFDRQNNYAFGEGGAGTFSDGKLTSRSKHISKEKQFILSSYIEAGAPEEIEYMAHPHLGTDNLKIIVENLRHKFQELGGLLLFETLLEGLKTGQGKVLEAGTPNMDFAADGFFIAPGHSAFETYRLLMKRGVLFRTKNFAIGSRMEHPQEIINQAQWGHKKLPGVKAAEYRLTSPADGKHQVYSFCMCPGGMVVAATAYPNLNIVNGMSFFQRDGRFANAGCVVGIHPDELAGREVAPFDALRLLEVLEESFYNYSNGYEAPFCSIADFINRKVKDYKRTESSYPLGLKSAELWKLLPQNVSNAMREGLIDFSRKIRGFESGNLLGLESKTSSPIQVVREKNGLCTGFGNLYLIGEGSGFAGGIISSAADGIRAALHFIESH